jgi:hypothetical protein
VQLVRRWAAVCLVATLTAVLVVPSAQAPTFTAFIGALGGFNTAAGTPPIVATFDPCTSGTFVPSGTTIGGVAFAPGMVPAPSAPLFIVTASLTFTLPGDFSGVIGGVSNVLVPTSGTCVLSPGYAAPLGGPYLAPGPNPFLENDDLALTFSPGVYAVGFDILFQSKDQASFVGIEVQDVSGTTIYFAVVNPTMIPTLVSGCVVSTDSACGGDPAGNLFLGFCRTTPTIGKVIVDDFDNDATFPDSNIGYDTIRVRGPGGGSGPDCH